MATGTLPQPERLILETRPHWLAAGLLWRLLALFLLLAATAAVLLVAVVAPPFGLLLLALDVVALLFLVLVPYVNWRTLSYRLTDRRLIIEDGLLTRRSKSIPLARLQDVTTEVGPLGRILGYGDVKVENAGETPGFDLLRSIPDPDRFRDLLLEYAQIARGDSL